MRVCLLSLFLLAANLLSPLSAGPVNPANFAESVYVSSADLGNITGIGWAPDGSGRLFVIRKGGFSGQQTAEVRVVKNGGVLPEVFASESVYTESECGLIGMCFDPNFLNNRYVYFFLTVSVTEQQIVRYTDLADAGARAASRKVIIPGLPTRGANHDGGGIGIGNDGCLYWSIGDLGAGRGVDGDLSELAAKVSRANRFTGAPLPDNPFFDGGGPNADHIWARGFRNPFTLTFQVLTGRLWVNTVGTDWEQVFRPRRGANAGYNDYENNQPPGFLKPVIAYRTNGTVARTIEPSGARRENGHVTFTTSTPHPFHKGAMATIAGVNDGSFNGTFAVASVLGPKRFTIVQPGADQTSGGGTATTQSIGGCITGGCFYDSTAFPAAYRGNFFFGDYNSGRIMRVPLDAENRPLRTQEFVTGNAHHVDMTTGPDGALYYAQQEAPGVVKRLVPTGSAQRVIIYPTALNVVEGGSSVVSVRLRTAPAGNVTFQVQRLSGDAQLAVSSGSTLTFTPANFATPQLITVAGTADGNLANSHAVFQVKAPGFADHNVVVNGIDDDEP